MSGKVKELIGLIRQTIHEPFFFLFCVERERPDKPIYKCNYTVELNTN